jgi:hypothetical protein
MCRKIVLSYLVGLLLLIGLGCDGGGSSMEDQEPSPTEIESVSGAGQTIEVGERSNPLTVKVVSQSGNPVDSVEVVFTVQQGNASIDGSASDTIFTGNDGKASVRVEAKRPPGEVEIQASAVEVQGELVNFILNSQWPLIQTGKIAEVEGNIDDAAVDTNRGVVHATLQNQNEVVSLAAESGEVLHRTAVGSAPAGIDLGLEGDSLYVALNEGGAVVVVNVNTRSTKRINVQDSTGSPKTYDVVEARPGRIFVSANPGSLGFAYIAVINRNRDDTVYRVANDRIISADPTFAPDPSQNFLLVGEGFSPNSLYKLDITEPDAPIIQEDDHGTVSGTSWIDVSPNSELIYLHSGQVLFADSFNQKGRVQDGVSAVSNDGSRVYVVRDEGIAVYETSTFTKQRTIAVEIPSRHIINGIQLWSERDAAVLWSENALYTVNLRQ